MSDLEVKPAGEIASLSDFAKLAGLMMEKPQVDCPVKHHFGGGVYMREMFAPAGTIVLGHEHITEHMCFLVKGSMKILKEDGSSAIISAPMVFTARPGHKLAITLEDVIFMNIHPTEETEVDRVEELFIRKNLAISPQEITEGIKILEGEQS